MFIDGSVVAAFGQCQYSQRAHEREGVSGQGQSGKRLFLRNRRERIQKMLARFTAFQSNSDSGGTLGHWTIPLILDR